MLLLPALLVAAVILALAGTVLWVLLRAPGLVGADQSNLAGAWDVLAAIAAFLIVAAGVVAAFSEAFGAIGAARRRWSLIERDHPWPADKVDAQYGGPGGRRIVICCDGTSNRPDRQEDGEAAPTNVCKLWRALCNDETQTVWYQAGVGSDTSSTSRQMRRTKMLLTVAGANSGSQVAAFFSRINRMMESAFGTGISEGIVNGYTEIVRQYRPGDRIYLIGFSRGAYTARCIAGVISRCGLLRAENIRYAEEMVRLYRSRRDQEATVQVRRELIHPERVVEFVGVFDTVASLGVPLWGWWFRLFPIWTMGPLATDPVKACRHVYHALAMDERRSEFVPTLFANPGSDRGPDDQLQTLEQVWFRGAHADIGGGYAAHELSDITLGWMMDAMGRHGLRLHKGARSNLSPDPLGRLHDEMERQPSWKLLGSWPRWHPAPGAGPDPQGTKLHPSVLERAAIVEARGGRPDLTCVGPEEPLTFVVEGRRDWDRTGIVIEQGVTYRLTYLGGLWRDAQSEPCRPAGQKAGAFDLRRWMESGRRLRDEPWMRLAATVAHPRKWELKEKGAGELRRILFGKDPIELTRQVAAIGQDLAWPGSSIMLRNDAPAGLLYLFANDWWQTASNNSGGLQLRIERLDEPDATLPLWTTRACGSWVRTAPVMEARP
ncbi:MAG: DUF2235 domain-containing protein [Alphaproteobacteria bacterium]|nr:DUF2235 domain-containing protein [Alphaproteobacteria bacterium]